MALYRYSAGMKSREDLTESGTIVAQSEVEAKKKLEALKFDHIRLRKMQGWKAFVGQFRPTIK